MDIAGQLELSPFRSNIYIFENIGSSEYDGLNLALEKRFSDSWGARLSYALGHSRGNAQGSVTGSVNPFQVLDERNLDQSWGPSPFDRRHVLTVSGHMEVPQLPRLTVSGVVRYMSGTPFTIHNSNIDVHQNGLTPDPVAAGTYSGTGANAITVDNDGGLRGAYGPDFFKIDLRIGYREQLGQDQQCPYSGCGHTPTSSAHGTSCISVHYRRGMVRSVQPSGRIDLVQPAKRSPQRSE